MKQVDNPPALKPMKIVSQSPTKEFQWEASEFIYTKKTVKWYLYLSIVTIVLIIIFRFLSKDWVTPILIITLATIFGLYANKKPKKINFSLGKDGVKVEAQTYQYGDLKSYSVVISGDMGCINLLPNKRFSPLIPLYFETKDQDKVLGALESQLPLNERKEDLIEKLMRNIGF